MAQKNPEVVLFAAGDFRLRSRTLSLRSGAAATERLTAIENQLRKTLGHRKACGHRNAAWKDPRS
jgi:hypothetical protein